MLFEGRLRIIAGRGFVHPDEVVGVSFDPRENPLTRRLLDDGQPIVLQDVELNPVMWATPATPPERGLACPW